MELRDFDDWYYRARPRLIVAIRGLGASRDTAADIVDDALAVAFERWSDVATMADPTGWTFVVARNRLRNRRTRDAIGRRIRGLLQPPDVGAPDDHLVEFEAMLTPLPQDQRTTLVLRYVIGMTEPEIAATLDIPRGTVSSRLRRAHDTLRRST